MKTISPCLVVMLTGAAMAAGSAVALAAAPDARGGHAVPVTQKAPPQPQQGRGSRIVVRHAPAIRYRAVGSVTWKPAASVTPGVS